MGIFRRLRPGKDPDQKPFLGFYFFVDRILWRESEQPVDKFILVLLKSHAKSYPQLMHTKTSARSRRPPPLCSNMLLL
jgi:hypothetical protein